MVKKTTKLILSMSLILFSNILFLNSIDAFGVSSQYWYKPDYTPAAFYPGETRTINLGLQNMVGEDDVTIRVKLIEGSEIASVNEKDYLVKAKTKDIPIPIEVSIPENTPINTTYKIVVSFIEVAPGGTGGVSLSTGIDTPIPVLVVEKPVEVLLAPEEKPINKWIIIGIVIIMIIITVVLIIRKKRKIRKLVEDSNE
ncbi:hypothetical protein HYV50_03265 [Candidatus Pacearchaeota archaeon]|nr:hypothetical protein [Candidatus Pacearchaeota archaeon]